MFWLIRGQGEIIVRIVLSLGKDRIGTNCQRTGEILRLSPLSWIGNILSFKPPVCGIVKLFN